MNNFAEIIISVNSVDIGKLIEKKMEIWLML